MKIKMKQSLHLSSNWNSSCHFVYVITFLWFIICVYKSHVYCLSLTSESESDLIQGNDHSQNQHAGTTDKTNPNKNQSSDSHSAQEKVEVKFLPQDNKTETQTETESKCKDELTPEACRNFVHNNLCEQKGNPNVSLCRRSCKVCKEVGVGGDKEKNLAVDSTEKETEQETHAQNADEKETERENWDRNKDEKNNKDCFDRFPNCTCRNVSNIVTCCNWINAQNLNIIPCRKSCGICGGNGVFSNKPPGSGQGQGQGSGTNGNGQTQVKNININGTTDKNGQTINTKKQVETRKNPSRPNFDDFCKPNPAIPILEPPFFPIGNQNGGSGNMC